MSAPPAEAPGARSELELFDVELIRHVLGFVARAVRRHPRLAVGSCVGVAVAGLAVAASWPRTWEARARLLANQSQLIRALGNPRTSLPSEDPTRAARELIFAHDNLKMLIRQTDLLTHWEASRPLLPRLRDQLVAVVAGPMSEEDRIDALVGLLEKRLAVTTDQQTVTIEIEWSDPKMAYLLVETAQQNFLETRHVTEMTAISEALSILESHATTVQKSVEDALHELERVRDQRRGARPRPAAPPAGELQAAVAPAASPVAPADAATEQELAQVKFLLNSKRRALADLEEFRARRVSELTAQLVEQKVQYADQHPVVQDTVRRIDALKQDSPQMSQVKADIALLLQEYARKGGKDPDGLVEPVRRSPTRAGGQVQAALSVADLADDPLVEFARNNLRVATAKYEELMMRIDGARIEQDTARAAFKYRYSVVRPASIPKKPLRPNVAMLVGAALALALVVGLLSAAVKDFLGGRLVEPWQVERALGLEVLARIRLP